MMVTILILGYLVGGIFSNEFMWRSDAIFFSARNGRDQATAAKIKAGICMVTVIYWAVLLVYTAAVLLYLGGGGLGLPGAGGPERLEKHLPHHGFGKVSPDRGRRVHRMPVHFRLKHAGVGKNQVYRGCGARSVHPDLYPVIPGKYQQPGGCPSAGIPAGLSCSRSGRRLACSTCAPWGIRSRARCRCCWDCIRCWRL